MSKCFVNVPCLLQMTLSAHWAGCSNVWGLIWRLKRLMATRCLEEVPQIYRVCQLVSDTLWATLVLGLLAWDMAGAGGCFASRGEALKSWLQIWWLNHYIVFFLMVHEEKPGWVALHMHLGFWMSLGSCRTAWIHWAAEFPARIHCSSSMVSAVSSQPCAASTQLTFLNFSSLLLSNFHPLF